MLLNADLLKIVIAALYYMAYFCNILLNQYSIVGPLGPPPKSPPLYLFIFLSFVFILFCLHLLLIEVPRLGV